MRINKALIGLGIYFLTILAGFAQTVPTITSVSPESGAVGSTVAIKGANFSAIASENTIYFGAVKAFVNTASTTELSVTVPSGSTYMPISVTVAGLTAFSSKPFVPTFTANQIIDYSSFGFNVDFSTGNTLYAIAIGDIDGDGYPDLVVTNSLVNSISIFRNTGTSGAISTASFAAKVDFATGLQPTKLSLGDLDGDGKLDIVVANRSDRFVSVFKNTSTKGSITTSSLATKVDFTTGSSPNSVAIGDLDNDGKPDLVSSNTSDGSLSVLKNVGTDGVIDSKTFATKIDIALPNAWIVVLGDIDVDGKLDLVASRLNSNLVSVFKNNTKTGVIDANSFAAKVDFKTSSGPAEIAIGDLNADGKPELVVANLLGSSVSVFENKGIAGSIDATSFATKVDYSAPAGSGSVAIGDLNGDGKPDLAMASSGNSTTQVQGTTVAVIRNIHTSGIITSTSFDNYYTYTAGTEPYSVAIGDLNGDQKPDLAVANASSKNISIVPSIIPSPTPLPTITSFTPTSGPVGTSVSIIGTNFSPVASSNLVRFNGSTAVVKSSTATNIIAVVPAGATTGNITVAVAGQVATSKDIFTVSVANPITISNQPLDVVRCLNDTTSYKIIATGTNLKYQWQFQISPTSTFVDVTNTLGYSGATSAVLRISSITNAMIGNYRCKLSADNVADLFSNTVLLTVSKPSTPTILTQNSEACTSTFMLQVQGFDKYTWKLANSVSPDTLKIVNQVTNQQGQFLVVQTTVGNFKAGNLKLYLTTENNTGCTRLDSTTLTYFPNEIPVLSNNVVVGDSVRLTAQSVVRGTVTYQGTWSTKGSAIIKTPNLANTIANKLSVGINKFMYTVNNACKTRDSLSITYLSNISVSAGKDSSTCSDTIVLAAISAPLGFSGVWRSTNKSLIFRDSTLATTKVSGLAIGVNKLTWNIKSGNSVLGSDEVIVLRDSPVAAVIPNYYNVCLADTILPAQLNLGETIVWKVISGGATIAFPNQPKSKIRGLKKFSPKSNQHFNEIEWTVSKGACTLKDTLPIYFADSLYVEGLSQQGLAGNTIKVLASQSSIISKGDRFDSVFVVPISSSNSQLILNRYSKNDTIFFVTNRKLKGDATYTYSLRNTCGATSNIATLSVKAINVRPNTQTIPLSVQSEKKFVYTLKVSEVDSNNFITKAEPVLPLPNGVVATAKINSDTTEVTFTIDFSNATEISETTYRVSFRLFDGENDGDISFIVPIDNNLGLTIYNAVSPNGDGKHDVFEIKGIEQEIYKNNKVEIFNRWGDRVYKQSGYNNKDVAFDGGTLPDGTYYYVLDLGNDRKLLSGFLLLSR